jgi:hypothetical protein
MTYEADDATVVATNLTDARHSSDHVGRTLRVVLGTCYSLDEHRQTSLEFESRLPGDHSLESGDKDHAYQDPRTFLET